MKIWLTMIALVLGGQAAWAQDTADPASGDGDTVSEQPDELPASDTGEVDEEIQETSEEILELAREEEDELQESAEEDDSEGDESGVAGQSEGESGDGAESQELAGAGDSEAEAVPHDNRSARGAERGGHHGTVSTMARAGLGPVFGALRSQGYGSIGIREEGGQVLVSAERNGEIRNLVYDSSTGALLNDESSGSSGSTTAVERFVNKINGKSGKERVSSKSKWGGDGSKSKSATKTKSRGGNSKASSGNRGGGKSKSGGGSNGRGGGNGKSKGGGKGKNK